MKGHLTLFEGSDVRQVQLRAFVQTLLDEVGTTVRDKISNGISKKYREIATCAKNNNFVFHNLSALIK